MKLFSVPAAVQGTVQVGYPASILVPLGIVEVVCLMLYLVPPPRRSARCSGPGISAARSRRTCGSPIRCSRTCWRRRTARCCSGAACGCATAGTPRVISCATSGRPRGPSRLIASTGSNPHRSARIDRRAGGEQAIDRQRRAREPQDRAAVAAADVGALREQQVEHVPAGALDGEMQRLRPAAPEGMRADRVHEGRPGGEQRPHVVQAARADVRRSFSQSFAVLRSHSRLGGRAAGWASDTFLQVAPVVRDARAERRCRMMCFHRRVQPSTRTDGRLHGRPALYSAASSRSSGRQTTVIAPGRRACRSSAGGWCSGCRSFRPCS